MLPETFRLGQNYPNPASASARIDFELAEAGYVTLQVFDPMSREFAVSSMRRCR